MIEHHSVKNLIVGAILTGGPNVIQNLAYKKVEVFNPFSQRVCEMPDLSGDEQIFGFHLLTFKARGCLRNGDNVWRSLVSLWRS